MWWLNVFLFDSKIDVVAERDWLLEVNLFSHSFPHFRHMLLVSSHFKVIHIDAQKQLFLFVDEETFPSRN